MAGEGYLPTDGSNADIRRDTLIREFLFEHKVDPSSFFWLAVAGRESISPRHFCGILLFLSDGSNAAVRVN